MFATTELFVLFLLSLIGAAVMAIGIARECSAGNAPDATASPKTDPYRKEVVSTKRGSPALLIIAGMAVAFFTGLAFFVKADKRVDAFWGAARQNMAEGRYRVLYRSSDGKDALIKSLDNGQTRYYTDLKPTPVPDPDKQYCFAVRAAGCRGYTYTIACPSE